MRLDLFLKTSRLVKRRAIAREWCESGRVLINGSPAKPARSVKQGDTLTLHFTSRIIELEITGMPDAAQKRPADSVYRVKSERFVSRNEDLWNENQSSS